MIGAEEGAEFERNIGPLTDGPGGQLDAFGAELLALLYVAIVDARAVDDQAVDIQFDRLGARGRACRLLGGWFGSTVGAAGGGCAGSSWRGLADIFPVAAALFVALQVEVEAVDADIAHLHFAAQQRQHAHRQAKQAQVGKGLVGGAGAGQGGLGQLQAEPGEQAPADIAIEGQLQVGLVAGQLTDFIFVVVGIEQVGQGEAQRHDDQQQPEEKQAEYFAERFHVRILVLKLDSEEQQSEPASIAPAPLSGPPTVLFAR